MQPGIVSHGIVEGEPGIFPDPISRLMRKVGGFFDRKRKPEPAEGEAGTEHRPADGRPDEAERSTSPAGEDRAGEPGAVAEQVSPAESDEEPPSGRPGDGSPPRRPGR